MGWTLVGRNVWLLGLTSLVTDVSSEMVTSVLPVYLMFQLHLSPASYGLVEGLQQGGASLARVASGLLTDRFRRYKQVAAGGYLASAFCRIGLLLVGTSPGGIAIITAFDRLGKGARTSPRDALISLRVPPHGLAAAFGVHRTLDTVGAMLGPFLAFALLRWTHDDYSVVFVVSFAVALIGVAILVAFVSDPDRAHSPTARPPRVGDGLLTGEPSLRAVALCAGILGLATIGDGLVYLALQQQTGLAASWLPLLYVATPGAFALCALPFGWIADRAGRSVVVVGGYVALLALYLVLLAPVSHTTMAILVVLLLGAYYAATDGVLPALASGVSPEAVRATGLSVVGACHDVGRLIASWVFGWIWSRGAVDQALIVSVISTAVALLVAAPRLLPRPTRRT